MKILFVSTAYREIDRPDEGLPAYLVRVTRGLSARGHDVSVVYGTNYSICSKEKNVSLYAVNVPDYIQGICADIEEQCLIIGYYLNKEVEELLSKNNYDIIQYVSIRGIASFYKGTVPAVMRLSSYSKAYYKPGEIYSQKEIDVLADYECNAARCVDAVFGPSKRVAGRFSKDSGIEVRIIETPFYNEACTTDESFLHNNLLLEKYVLFFGRLCTEKGIAEIAEILEDFLHRNPELVFVAIGNNELVNGQKASNLLKNGAGKYSDRVFVYQPIKHEQLFCVIENAEFVVLPYYGGENFSNACIEAMYFGKTLIGTDDQQITDGINGILCKPENADDLLKKMNYAASLTEAQKEIIHKAAQGRVKKLHPDVVLDRLVELYQKTISESTPEKRDVSFAINIDKKAKELMDSRMSELFSGLMNESGKQHLYNRLLIQWTKNNRTGRGIARTLQKLGYKDVAIYGAGDVGKMLASELEDAHINISYVIDMIPKYINLPYPVYSPKDRLPECDLIIVTPIHAYEAIFATIKPKVKCDVVSVEKLVFIDCAEEDGA